MFIAGFATKEEVEALTKMGFEVEDARTYGLVGDRGGRIMRHPKTPGTEAVAIFIDASIADMLLVASKRFEVISQRQFDEYPGDGLRLVPLSNNDNTETKNRIEAGRGGGIRTDVLRVVGLKDDLQEGDIVEVRAQLVERLVTKREKV